ncbi:HIT domain-containing protein [Halobacteriovorax sp. HLS]|uniref:HIT domain-containing protein n=1 Tax=Halobacteriovorax sp. HLS TaxID=2234000 RepID=UPI000FDB43FE|nr:HIT family protein [Halobacteriovorax sp. HLS]
MKINERLVNDSEHIANLCLSELRLIRDGELDWFMLIPLKDGLTEWFELSHEDQCKLSEEITLVSKLLKSEDITKVNVGSLGNVVSQLHIHIIGRKSSDRAWPNAVWGTQSPNPFNMERVEYWREKFSKEL